MTVEIIVPQIGEVITELELVGWLKEEGDYVKKGEPLFEIDSDKAIVEVEAFVEGTLVEILVPAGNIVVPQEVVGVIAETGEVYPAEALEQARVARPSEAPRPARPSTIPPAPPEASVQPMSRLRQAIATRMHLSKQSIPHFYLMANVDMSGAQALRTYCRDKLGWEKAPTYTDIIVRACALTLAGMPEVNVSYADDGVVQHTAVNIGVAVVVDDGLIVPVVSDADRLNLAETSNQIRDLTEQARGGRLQASALAQKSMAVSNLGMYGADTFVAIIDMPDPMILAVGRVADRVVPIEGQIAIRPMCTLTLSIDHRVLDGVKGAVFLERVKDRLEHPFELIG